MRKRQRGPSTGQYTDADTGEIRTVETSRHVKQQHRKSGAYSKQPTEKELRQWDRQDTLRDRADKIKQREENKRLNAERRNHRLAKEREAVEQQYADGKITLTQTLAKKDQDQLNLHKWFGGCAIHQLKPRRESDCQIVSFDYQADEGGTTLSQESIRQSAQESDIEHRNLAAFFDDNENLESETSATDNLHLMSDVENAGNSDRPSQAGVRCDNNAIEKVEVVKELKTCDKTKFFERDYKETTQNSFKKPDLPPRLCRDPVLKVLNEQAPVSNRLIGATTAYDSNLAIQSISNPLDATAIQNLLAGICTQDLQDFEGSDKENDDGDCSKRDVVLQPAGRWDSKSKTENTDESRDDKSTPQPTIMPQISAGKIGDSALHVDDPPDTPVWKAGCNVGDEFDEYDLDDETLLMAVSSAGLSNTDNSLRNAGQQSLRLPPKLCTEVAASEDFECGIGDVSFGDSDLLQVAAALDTNQQTKRIESFAMDGIEDDDLLEGLSFFEQKFPPSIGTTRGRKRRVLPWNVPTQEDFLRNTIS